MTFWWRLRSMFGATLAGLGWRRSSMATLAYRPVWIPHGPFWKRWWYRLRPPSAPPQPFKPVGLPPWAGPPESEIGVALPMRQALHRTVDVVIAVTDLTAYSNGFEFRIAVRSKAAIDPRDMGFGPPPFRETGTGLSVELRYADGRSKTSSGGGPDPDTMDYYRAAGEGEEPAIPPGPVLGHTSGGGGGRRWDFHWWVWPLPPDGLVTITCHWPARGIDSTPVELDGAAIRRAGEQSKSVWDSD
jgi:hypothetical protein